MSDKNLEERNASEETIKKTSEETPQEETEKVLSENSEKTETVTEGDIVSEEKLSPTHQEDDPTAEEEDVDDLDEEHEEDTEDEAVDYHALSKKELIAAFQKLLKDKPIQSIKNAVEEIKTEFNAKFNDDMEEKKEEFLAEGGNIIDFQYTTPLKKEFNSLYFDYKEKRNNYYKNLKRDLQENLSKRLELIEELKGLLNIEENINTTYKHFKEIQEKWHVSGAIPRDKYNTVWNTYHHHVENFYDFLHLNREFRDLDFKHNLEQKLKVIGRAEELAQEEDLSKAFRELQMLHKMWKEDIGPVAKEYRDEVWDKFSAATKVIHDKRLAHLQELEAEFEKNHELKKELIQKIEEITQNTKANHKAWQQAMKAVQELRDSYFETGKVPKDKNKESWAAFKNATRAFNHSKNDFYKNQKKEQYENLSKKLELIKIAEENKDGNDFEAVTPLMKKIQLDWKQIGHVPKKDSDKIWKQFKNACNYYFNRLHASKNKANEEELANLEKKETLLKQVEAFTLTGKNDEDLSALREKINQWKNIGRVPFNKKGIDQNFNKLLDSHFAKLKLNKQEVEMIRFENKLNAIASQEDERKLQNEEFFISKKISEIRSEILQLENNLGFFQHVDENNPLVKEVHKNIKKQKEELGTWKEKLKTLRNFKSD
ncbi:MAG: DUF349 domain-containing protein [Flavobacteriaceae bacterium]|nr:DUF349 domain-containing protein [Flavobacteriaceae bacterium]